MTALDVAIATLVTDPVVLGLIDRYLLEVHAGQALVGLFVLAMLAVLPLRSRKLLALNITLFGLIFVLTPFWVVDGYAPYLFAGIGMIFIGTMLFALTER